MSRGLKIVSQIVAIWTFLYVFLLIYEQREWIWVYGMISAGVVAATTFFREKIESLTLCIVAHIALGIVMIAGVQLLQLPGGVIGFSVVWIVLSLLMCFVPKMMLAEEPGYFHMAVAVLAYLIGVYGGLTTKQRDWVVYGFIVLVLLKIVYGNGKATEKFIRNRASSTTFDEVTLKSLNQKISWIFAGVMAVALGLVSLLKTEAVSNAIGGFFRKIIGALLSKLVSGEEPQSNGEGGDLNDLFSGLTANSDGEVSTAAEIINTILEIVGVVVVIAVVIAFIGFIVTTIYRSFYGKDRERPQSRDYVEKLTRRSRVERTPRRNLREMLEKNPSKRVRKEYKKFVRRNQQPEILKRQTPKQQLEQAIIANSLSEEEAMEVRRLYEKARYGTQMLSEGEADRMHKLLS